MLRHHRHPVLTFDSPELVGDQSVDYAIYSLDATEGLDNELYEGQGLLSWGLSQPARLAKFVSGFVKPSLSGNVFEVRIKLSQVAQSSQQDFITSMQNYERISKTLPTTFDYSNWNEYLRTNNNESEAVKGAVRINKQRAPPNTLQKVRELAGRQGPRDMSAQLKTARQQQTAQQKHARLIAQQAAAIPANGANNFMPSRPVTTQKRIVNGASSEGTLVADLPSPPLPTPSSPPQMKTFPPPPAPPPVPVARTNSLPAAAQPHAETGPGVPQLARYTSAPTVDTLNDQSGRGLKRKASELESSGAALKRSINFSPSKAINAARSSIGAVQQLFKSKSPDARPPINAVIPDLESSMLQPSCSGEDTTAAIYSSNNGPKTQKSGKSQMEPYDPSNQQMEAQLRKAIDDAPSTTKFCSTKFCFNCGNCQTRGNWRQLELHGTKHNLCNACGVYWKTNNRMRPSTLWNRVRSSDDPSRSVLPSVIPAHSAAVAGHQSGTGTPTASDNDQSDSVGVAQTSPVKPHDRRQTMENRATRSSPVPPSQVLDFTSPKRKSTVRKNGRIPGRPQTPTRETLHEIHPNTPAPPSPSPASGTNFEDLSALLVTPKKQFPAKLFASPSPWRSMFGPLDDLPKDLSDSPSKQNLDKFLENLGTNFDFDAFTAKLPMSPSDQQNFDSIASFLSSPGGMQIFTSSAGMENDDSTPEEPEPLLSASKVAALLRTPIKNAQRLQEHFEEGDSLFTPKRYHTRSQPTSAQRNLRSAGSMFEDERFSDGIK